jgi:hypothetical protein
MSRRRHVSWITIGISAGLLIVATAAAQPPAPAGDNLLQNPGFESGLSFWSICNGEAAPSTDHVHGGGSSVELTQLIATGEAAICQSVPVTPLASYSASGYFYLHSPGIVAQQMQIVWQTSSGEAIVGALAGCSAGTWIACSVSGQAPANASSALVRARVYLPPAAITYVDDTAFIQTAPPPTETSTRTTTATRTSVAAHTPTATHPASPSRTLTATSSAIAQTPPPSRTATATASATPSPVILINEVEYNCNHSDLEAYYEWFELYNPSGVAATLTGWTISDNSTSATLPDVTIGPGGLVVVAARQSSFLENYPSYSGPLIELGQPIGNGLANSGDRLLLRDGSGRRVDALSYGSDTSVFSPSIPTVAGRGHSLERYPLGRNTQRAGDFQEQSQPSPGQGWEEPTATATATETATETPTETPTTVDTPAPSTTVTGVASASPTPPATVPRYMLFLPVVVRDPPPTPTATPTLDPHDVTLNELLPAPHTVDWNGDGTLNSGDEWVELYNSADVSVDVSGWALDDEAEAGSPLYFLPPGTVIAPHGFLLLFGKQTGLSFADTKDVVRLLYRNGTLLDEYRYFATWKDRSFSKTADGGQAWTYWYPPSPGQPNRP